MADVFISYRRQDCPGATGRLADRLHAELGADRVFLDVGDIVPGADFVQTLHGAVAGATVLLAVVGPNWLDARDAQGRRRLDDPDDFVRCEVEMALAAGTPVIPVLLEGARMPGAQALPPSLQAFAHCQAVALAHDHWEADMAALVGMLAARYGIYPSPHGAGGVGGMPWRRAPVALLLDLAELLAQPRTLITRRAGSGAAAGSDAVLLRALAMLLLCLVLGNLLLGMVLDRPLAAWTVAGITLGLLLVAALAGLLSMCWRLVRRRPGWRRIVPLFAYVYGGAWLYFCAGAVVMALGTQLVKADVFTRALEQAARQGNALDVVAAVVGDTVHGPAVAAGVLGSLVWLAGLAWCLRAWAVFRTTLGSGRLAASAATLLWLALLAALGALARFAAS